MKEKLDKAVEIATQWLDLTENWTDLITYFDRGIQVSCEKTSDFFELARSVGCEVLKEFREDKEFPVELFFIYAGIRIYMIH